MNFDIVDHLGEKVGSKVEDCFQLMERDIENSFPKEDYFERLPKNLWRAAKEKATPHFDRLLNFLTNVVNPEELPDRMMNDMGYKFESCLETLERDVDGVCDRLVKAENVYQPEQKQKHPPRGIMLKPALISPGGSVQGSLKGSTSSMLHLEKPVKGQKKVVKKHVSGQSNYSSEVSPSSRSDSSSLKKSCVSSQYSGNPQKVKPKRSQIIRKKSEVSSSPSGSESAEVSYASSQYSGKPKKVKRKRTKIHNKSEVSQYSGTEQSHCSKPHTLVNSGKSPKTHSRKNSLIGSEAGPDSSGSNYTGKAKSNPISYKEPKSEVKSAHSSQQNFSDFGSVCSEKKSQGAHSHYSGQSGGSRAGPKKRAPSRKASLKSHGSYASGKKEVVSAKSNSSSPKSAYSGEQRSFGSQDSRSCGKKSAGAKREASQKGSLLAGSFASGKSIDSAGAKKEVNEVRSNASRKSVRSAYSRASGKDAGAGAKPPTSDAGSGVGAGPRSSDVLSAKSGKSAHSRKSSKKEQHFDIIESVVENQLYHKSSEQDERLKSEISEHLESDTDPIDISNRVPPDEVKLEAIKEEPGTGRDSKKEEVITIQHTKLKVEVKVPEEKQLQRVPNDEEPLTPDILSGCDDLSDTEEHKKELEDELDTVQKKIEEVGQRLKQIKAEKEGLDEESEEYARLEKQRNELRKEVVELDYLHKQVFIKYKKHNQKEVRKSNETGSKSIARSRKQEAPQREEQSKLEASQKGKEELFDERQSRINEIKKEIMASRMKQSSVMGSVVSSAMNQSAVSISDSYFNPYTASSYAKK